jgi:Tfp pilus assembly protein PilO
MKSLIKSETDLQRLRWTVHGCGALVTVLIVFTAWWIAFYQTETDVQSWRASLAEDSLLLNDEPRLRSQLRDSTRELQTLEGRLNELTALIPDRPEESLFLAQLSELASSTKLQIRDFRPGGVQQSNEVMQLSIQLTGTASYECLCRFLDGLQSLRRLTQVSQLKVSPGVTEGIYPVEMELTIFFANQNDAAESTTKVARR